MRCVACGRAVHPTRIQVLADVLCVGEAEDRVDAVEITNVRVDKESLREGTQTGRRRSRAGSGAGVILSGGWTGRLLAGRGRHRPGGTHKGDRGRVGEAGGLDEDVVELLLPLHESREGLDEVAADGAAHAAARAGGKGRPRGASGAAGGSPARAERRDAARASLCCAG